VFHIGARTDTTEFDYTVHQHLNVEYSQKIWHYCTVHHIPLVYASSAATYGAGELGYDDSHELVPRLKPKLRLRGAVTKLAFHPPCTLQHGQQLRGGVETHLNALGFDVRVAANENHLCCGSAGTYSVLQPQLARTLRERKLERIGAAKPGVILSSNIGCIQHLQGGTAVPVMHWIEWLDGQLQVR